MLVVVVPYFNMLTVSTGGWGRGTVRRSDSLIFPFLSQEPLFSCHGKLTINSTPIQKRRTFELGGITKTVFPNDGYIFRGFTSLLILTLGKNRISLLIAESPDFFTCYSRFSFSQGLAGLYLGITWKIISQRARYQQLS